MAINAVNRENNMAAIPLIEINNIPHYCYVYPGECRIIDSKLKASPKLGIHTLIVEFYCGTHWRYETEDGSSSKNKKTVEELLELFVRSYTPP